MATGRKESTSRPWRDGFVSVTPLHLDLTTTRSLAELEAWLILRTETPGG